jgi:hypothetical protein
MERALEERQQFHADYDEANACWRRGNRSVVFPAGTIRHRKVNNADCPKSRV